MISNKFHSYLMAVEGTARPVDRLTSLPAQAPPERRRLRMIAYKIRELDGLSVKLPRRRIAMDVKESTTSQPAIAKRRVPDFTEQLIEPFTQLRSEVDRLFDSFPLRLPSFRFARFAAAPAIDMTETDKAYKVTAELPGMDPENVDVTFDDGLLRIAGEKQEQREENERGYQLSERAYGSFERLINLPSAAQGEKIKAKFKNGVLTVTVPKDAKVAATAKRIAIERG